MRFLRLFRAGSDRRISDRFLAHEVALLLRQFEYRAQATLDVL
jgi:hypothetical protein